MEIDDKLKNRLAGTAVVTVLAVIFLPMMFDDPVEKKGQVVSELGIPRKPEVSPLLTTAIVPDKSTAVTAAKPKPAETNTATAEPAEKLSAETDTTLTESELEKPAAVDSEGDAQEQENPAPVKKKSHKKAAVAEDAVEEKPAKPKAIASAEEKKPAKTEKKPAKSKLPVLDTADVAPAAHADAPPTLDNRRWVIQVASLSDQAKATAFRDKLRAQGFPATVDSAWIKGKGRVYRLKVGPELDAQKAQAIKAKINQLNNVNSIAIAE